MLLGIALPQSDVVDLMFAYDLANLIGHLSTTFPQVDVKLFAVKQEEDGTLLSKEEIVRGAMDAGANLVVFLGDERRFGPQLLDKMLVVAVKEFIEAEAKKQAQTLLTTGALN